MMNIKDKLIEPFFIEVDENQFILKEKYQDSKGKDAIRVWGYYHKIDSALNKMVRINTVRKGRDHTLSSFIVDYAKDMDTIRGYLKTEI